MGRRTNSARTPEQTTFGLFFSGANLAGVVRSVALARLTDSGDLARLFALAYVSASDAIINTWNNKRTYNFWRPSTAILEAANDGNPRTAPDPRLAAAHQQPAVSGLHLGPQLAVWRLHANARELLR